MCRAAGAALALLAATATGAHVHPYAIQHKCGVAALARTPGEYAVFAGWQAVQLAGAIVSSSHARGCLAGKPLAAGRHAAAEHGAAAVSHSPAHAARLRVDTVWIQHHACVAAHAGASGDNACDPSLQTSWWNGSSISGGAVIR